MRLITGESRTDACGPLGADALGSIGRRLVGGRGKHWRMIGIDPDGMDLKCGAATHRVEFDQPVETTADCRRVLVELARQAG